MTVELLTGTPGAGKTCYGVNERVLPESAREWTVDDPESVHFGKKLTRRIIVCGIRDLAAEHERIPHKLTGEVVTNAEVDNWNAMIDDDVPKHQRLPGEEPHDVPALFQNWWLWCKPGDLVVVDEAQYVLPRGTLGRKPPYYVMALDIHRHYAVDFLFITQHPNKIATEVRGLVGLHRHIRSVMGSSFCVLYAWDHASNPERFTMANKSTWIRRSKHYKTYKSAVAHLAPPVTGRSVLWITPLLIGAVVLGTWQFSKRFTTPAQPAAQSLAATKPAQQGQGRQNVPSPLNPAVMQPRVVQGCYSVGESCACIGLEGQRVSVGPYMCKLSASSFSGLVKWERSRSVRYEDKRAQPAPEPSAAAASTAAVGNMLKAL